MDKLFLNNIDDGVCFSSLTSTFAIDCSGSTSGSILRYEIQSCNMLSEFIPCNKIISWDTQAKIENDFNSITSRGGTNPSCIIPLIDNNIQSLVLYTDGQIRKNEMENFQKHLKNSLQAIPIIVVFTMNTSFSLSSTISQLEKQVDMSIPEGCLALSNDSCIIVNVLGSHKVLMASGALNIFGKISLLSDTLLESLPDFDMTLLKSSSVIIRSLPNGYINLNGFSNPLSLNTLYEMDFNDIPYDIINALCDRVYFAKLNISKMHKLLSNKLRSLDENPLVEDINKKLAIIAADPTKSGSKEHHQLLEDLKLARLKSKNKYGEDITKYRSLLHRFLSMLAEYSADRTTIALGSNRANRAKIINADAFDEGSIGECIQIKECPIYLQQGNACILIKLPSNILHNNSLEEYCTNDISMEAPFSFGCSLQECITPGIYCLEFAKQAKTNPYTREKVLGYIPLAIEPSIIMRYMARIFADSRELWHLVRAYIAMMTKHCENKQWANIELIKEQLQILIDKYECNYHLLGNTDDKRPLRECFKYVTKNYSTALRHRLPDDVRVILSIIDYLMPEWKYKKQKIESMVNIIDDFSFMLRELKKDTPLLPFILNLDEYDHCINERKDLRSIIARIFWYNKKNINKYKGLKLQSAIDTALLDKKFGNILRSIFSGESFDINDEVLKVAYDEPTGIHFSQPKYDSWNNFDGRPKTQCVYCGKSFTIDTDDIYTPSPINIHLREAFGKHFYNGQKAVLQIYYSLKASNTTITEIQLFKLVKKQLYHEYGEQYGALHTQRCKTVLLDFIRKLLE